ncbi:winged helix-turn-helix transcriptional regulator [Magnetospirillum sp. SS-4]|uniref:winged helix-turn-helix transcriptional regulator n=1 Tax=Magnetospirillum sp. SS-4 TaxID=2681465 RepID=UPI001384E33A|nr:winged helix-turn-helix transcriptional regulator [Magnetospirillum sp. SS-4]CAA7612629.1 conserved hypothetical protein [Magnetospirillum sp. SS-4]
MEKEGRLTLDMLKLIQTDAHVTQRRLANELGIALGLANSYLRRCIRKGYVKVTSAPTNRYAYYLTPTGLAEKSALVARYLSYSFQFFRDAKGQCESVFRVCEARGWRRVAVCGTGDLAEITVLAARDFDVDTVGPVDVAAERDTDAIAADLASKGRLDAVVLADLSNPQAAFERLGGLIAPERILPLPMLDVHVAEKAES